jgi:hypothetical protein
VRVLVLKDDMLIPLVNVWVRDTLFDPETERVYKYVTDTSGLLDTVLLAELVFDEE